MYINFQHNRAHKYICKKNRKLHEFATTNKIFLNSTLRHASSLNVHVYQFSAQSG